MNSVQFAKRLAPYRIFSLQDVRNAIPGFSYRQLDRWQKQGSLQKIKQGFYAFTDLDVNEALQYHVANKVYRPSYVSLEQAMKFYGFIPEEVFQITSVSTKKTAAFYTPIGNFNYRHIKPSLFWGYRLVNKNNTRVLLAEPEKAVLDYLYFHPHLKTGADFIALRINNTAVTQTVSQGKLLHYANAFGKNSLLDRVKTFLSIIDPND
jgi:predicted transcriptional regulator of viral defense system